MGLVLDVSLPISERSIWQASVLMPQSPASNQSKDVSPGITSKK